MGKHLARIMGSLGATAVAGGMFGVGVASADPLTGKTYTEAVAVISEWKSDAVISTVSGAQVARDDCVVVSWHRSISRDASGNGPGTDVMLNLNCYAGLASPGKPGYSMASPEGRERAEDNSLAEYFEKNPGGCLKSDQSLKWCERLCHRTGLCDIGS